MDATPTPGAAAVAAAAALELRGANVLPLLHRISTQALLDLAPGMARATLFCDFRGRLLHRAVVTVTRDGAVWLLRDDAPGATLAAFVDRHVFREQVRTADRSIELAIEAVRSAPGEPPGMIEHDGIPERVTEGDMTLRVRPGPVAESTPEERAGRERGRIRAGRAAHGHEIVEAFHPFEVGLGADVHLDKGCFTGQEALQRLVTYGSVRRRLVRLEGRGIVPAVPAAVRGGGAEAGVLTSAVEDATIDAPERWIGLAVIRNDLAEGAQPLEVDGRRLEGAPHFFPLARPRGRP